MIDLRSDTLTRPTPEMRAAIAAAEVGDDVFGEDPTVRHLEEQTADLLGKEAAMFVPSGTMGNQIGVRIHCGAGEEFLCEAECHILNQEQAASAQFFGVFGRGIVAEEHLLTVGHLQDKVRPDDVHYAPTRMVCLENTHNRGGGRVLPFAEVEKISTWAAACGLARHLDGARLFNAVVASGIAASEWARLFDTISVCFSKGLGAPVGSALVGPHSVMKQARRLRKALGGGWRQAGLLAAAASYALDHHVERLAGDHDHAQILTDAIRQSQRLRLAFPNVETNIVIFDLDPSLGTSAEFCRKLAEKGVGMYPFGKYRVRAVTHLDVTAEQTARAAEILLELSK